MKTCLALRHVLFEDLGTLTPVLQRNGFEVSYVEGGIDDLKTARIENVELLVILGGPIGVYDEHAYPFLIEELRFLKCRLGRERPTLGICLGAQLLAKSMGAKVSPGPAKEIGWTPVELTDEGNASPLRHLAGVSVLHWHGDNFELPADCENLASTARCPVQAFRKGPNLLGLQFHLEADPRRMESWLIGHTVELAKASIDPASIRADTVRFGQTLIERSNAVFEEWLCGLKP